MRESSIVKKILGTVGARKGVRLFRNSTFLGWAGVANEIKPRTVLVSEARPVTGGLCTGSADLIGWSKLEITQDMVGKSVAIFTALECKTPKGRASKEQLNFIAAVQNAGGYAGIVRSLDDVEDVYNDFNPPEGLQ